MSCKGINVSDALNKYRFPFYDSDGNITKKYYHIPIKCSNNALGSYDLCGICKEKENKLNSYLIINNTLKSSTKTSVCHPSVLHGKVDESIPIWSHIIGGEWFKNMLTKGYRKEAMAPKKKTEANEVKPNEVVANEVTPNEAKPNEAKPNEAKPKEPKAKEPKAKEPKAKEPKAKEPKAKEPKTKEPKAKEPNTKEPKIKEPKVKEPKAKETKDKETNNVIEHLMTKMYIDDTKKEEVYDIVKLEVKRITILGKEYYYEPTKDKLYTLDYDYVGRYDKKNEVICTNYPDSDQEPDT